MLQAERDFIARHLLNWVPIAKTKLEKTGAPAFPVLLTLLVRFLSMRQQERAAL
jgi:TorA maturation chaperone TorD